MIITAKDSYMIHADRKVRALAALSDRNRFLPAGAWTIQYTWRDHLADWMWR
jgi:hypothetical protein